MLTIAGNLVASHHRAAGAKKRGRPLSLDFLTGRADGEGEAPSAEPVDGRCIDPLDRLMRSEAVSAMDRAAEELSPNERELYSLRRQGLSTAEIAERTGRSQSAIGSALTRLLGKLRSKLPSNEP